MGPLELRDLVGLDTALKGPNRYTNNLATKNLDLPNA